jgi:photoactive yellow protein
VRNAAWFRVAGVVVMAGSPWRYQGAEMDISFTEPGLLDLLDAADDAALDALRFGVVAMAQDGTVSSYNTAESLLSGMTPANVLGRNFFTSVAPCTNNFMVAYRFETEPILDDVIDYVFTLHVKPTAVRLRLLKQPARRRMYLVVQRK